MKVIMTSFKTKNTDSEYNTKHNAHQHGEKKPKKRKKKQKRGLDHCVLHVSLVTVLWSSTNAECGLNIVFFIHNICKV
jgi:hypothetical protein